MTRDPGATRQRILEAAFREMHRHGFRNASLDRILADTQLTKGALYYHFPTKADLGYAVIDEVIREKILGGLADSVAGESDPIDALVGRLRRFTAGRTSCEFGCPLNNLAQEMSSESEEFRLRLQAVYRVWQDRVEEALLRGQCAGTVKAEADCRRAALFFVASMEGTIGLAKLARDPSVLRDGLEGLAQYLESLRSRVPVGS